MLLSTRQRQCMMVNHVEIPNGIVLLLTDCATPQSRVPRRIRLGAHSVHHCHATMQNFKQMEKKQNIGIIQLVFISALQQLPS